MTESPVFPVVHLHVYLPQGPVIYGRREVEWCRLPDHLYGVLPFDWRDVKAVTCRDCAASRVAAALEASR